MPTNATRTDTSEYYDHLGKWVLGQLKRSVNLETNVVAGHTEFDPATALPAATYGTGTPALPGKLLQAVTYRADGTASAIGDGNNSITKLSNWHRGIPREVQFADGSTQTAGVNAAGWVTSTTDENGFQTNYTHDAMGRVTSIAQPTGDSIAWSSTTIGFEKNSAAQWGLPAGHWQQTIITGTGYKQTYFDALWRPLLSREFDSNAVTATSRFTRRSYDAAGRQIFVSYPGATDAVTAGIRTIYDALDRVVRVEQDSELGVLTTHTEYLPDFKTKVTNPRGLATTTQFQAWDAPTYDMPVRIDAPEGAATTIVRDVWGKPLEVTRGAGP